MVWNEKSPLSNVWTEYIIHRILRSNNDSLIYSNNGSEVIAYSSDFAQNITRKSTLSNTWTEK